jgi:hypothetical protein
MSGPLEVDFESTICSWLVEHGAYVGPVKVGNAQGNPRDFDAVRGLDTAEIARILFALALASLAFTNLTQRVPARRRGRACILE